MTDLVRFEIPDGGDVLIEAEDVDEGLIPVKRGQDGIFDTGMFFSDRLDSIQDAVKEALKKLRMTNPDEIKVSFGVNIQASVLDVAVGDRWSRFGGGGGVAVVAGRGLRDDCRP